MCKAAKKLTITEIKRRRSPHQPTGQWIRTAKRFAIYRRDGEKCLVCGKKLTPGSREASLDHIIPRSKGGSNHETNLFTACVSCNSARQTTPLEKFASFAAIARIEKAIAKPLNIRGAKRRIARRR